MSPFPDPISLELRSVEREIDKAYRSNILLKDEFATSAWFLLAFVEDMALMSTLKEEMNSIHDVAVLADNLIVHLRYPLFWLLRSCSPGGDIPFRYDDDHYKAAWELLDLGRNYQSFVSAFTYANRRIIGLELQGNQVLPVHNFLVDTRYEAYNRLIKPSLKPGIPDTQGIYEAVGKSLQVRGERFSYNLNPKIISLARTALQPTFDTLFVLPSGWQFSRYSLQDFRNFYEIIASIAAVHWCAQQLAAADGCVGLGFADSIRIMDREELVQRVTRYAGLKEQIVLEILNDMTYGDNILHFPDPAIQPLIPLTHDRVAVVPWLWLGNAAERNFTVLLNKLPSEKHYYARLVNEKEQVLQQQMQSMWSDLSFRYYSGSIPGDTTSPDIDLAIISDAEKACILLELKWFIAPADIGEVIEKTEELQKGVAQLVQLRDHFEKGYPLMLDALGIDSSYTLCLVVASANWIGHADIQHPNVAIIKADHIARRIAVSQTLRSTIDWINNRAYLPEEGKEYRVTDDISTIKNWSLKWYGVKPLLSDVFFPL